ncbi:MAG: hypothetical protein JSV56_03445 [Methanomassiliicoccales archaeon]|nr:MAG: hypothetical protein JSV56_03445 [Methanomassiliicoccales archaeon]
MKKIFGIFFSALLVISTILLFIPEEVDSGNIPDEENNTVYWHAGGGHGQWLNTLQQDPESDPTYTHSETTINPFTYGIGFQLRNAEEDMKMDAPMHFEKGVVSGVLHLEFDESGQHSDNISIGFIILDKDGNDKVEVWEELPYQASGYYSYNLQIENCTAEEGEIVLMDPVWNNKRGTTSVTIYLEGDTYTTFPILDDTDGDGIIDKEDSDDDQDEMPDTWEDSNGLDSKNASDADDDPDNDGLTNLEECNYDTNPNSPDTDGDGHSDGYEITWNSDPKDDQSEPSVAEGEKEKEKGFLEKYLIYIAATIFLLLIIIIIILVVVVKRRG